MIQLLEQQMDDGQDLNQSRFLFEELNMDDEPTEEEVLERADELDIDDLALVRESLTRQLDPEWKPYCNRKGEIYYINLLTKKAYQQHPIDMMYKQIYAKQQGIAVPKFKVFRLEDIAQSFYLIQNQINSLESQQIGIRGLNIVYEEPSEEQKSSYLKSPSHQDDLSGSQEGNHHRVGIEEEQQIERFRQQLTQKYEQELQHYKNERRHSFQELEEKCMKRVKQKLWLKIRESERTYEQQLKDKNIVDERKIIAKISKQNEEETSKYEESINRFLAGFQQLREKQSNIESLSQEKDALEKVNFVNRIKDGSELNKRSKIYNLKQQMLAQFNRKIVKLAGTSKGYQQKLQQDLDRLFATPNKESIWSNLRKPQKHTVSEPIAFVDQHQSPSDEAALKSHPLKVQNNINNDEQGLKIWQRYRISDNRQGQRQRYEASLLTRLKIKLI